MDDEDREPREGEDQEEEEEVWEVTEPPIPVPKGKYKLLNNLLADTGEWPISVTSFKFFLFFRIFSLHNCNSNIIMFYYLSGLKVSLSFFKKNPLEQVGRTTFFTNRPAHILKSSSLQTFGCLCQTHENAGLMLKTLRSVVPSTISVSPDTFCGDYPDAESVSTLVEQADTTSEISFSEWQRVKCGDGKQRTKIVVCKLPADDFLQKVTRVVEDFRDHAGRVNTQYVELKKLKDSLPTTSLLLQMDFAENFSCSSGPRNVQSSYWNPQIVTLHPIMVYYRETVGGGASFCYMSSVPSHNTTMVVTILKSLLLTELRPLLDHLDINKVYYITDSPVSQYKFIFYVVSCHQQIFGMPAVWHYFEKGHGKGPCDGIGGAVKRGAAQAAKQDWFVVVCSYVYARNSK